MFNLFRRNKSRSPLRPPRGPGETIRPEDEQELKMWAADKAFIEAFIEPETVVNEMSVVFVDASGEWTRRKIGGPQGIDVVHKQTGVPLYFAEETGYPQRMRARIERDRVMRKREEQKARRAKFERGELPD